MKELVGNRVVTPMIHHGWWFDLVVPLDGVNPPRIENARTSAEHQAEQIKRTVAWLWSR